MIRSSLLSKLKDGYISLDTDEVIEELLKGNGVNNITLTDNSELQKYIESCNKYHTPVLNLSIKQESHAELIKKWRIPKEYLDIDPVEYIVKRCKTDVEFKRAGDELVEFNKRNQLILINLMIYIVDLMRKNNIVWGIGRGSSVASFCLFLIGINKINPLEYDIDYREFFK
jgi:hypothetical protein